MVANKSDANWVQIDVETLNDVAKKYYSDYKTAYAMMKSARQQFEENMAQLAELPEGKRMVFGYNFGKLSVAIVDDDRKAAKPAPAKQSLADFIASQAQAGRRT